MNRKIAVFFSGRLTEEYFQKENLQKLKEHYNAIFFCALNEGADKEEFIKKFMEEFDVSKECINIEKCIVPKELYERVHNIKSYNNVYSMYYNNKMCYNLIKKYEEVNNIKFEVIVRYRSEIRSENVIDIKNEVKENTVYIPNKYDWGGINDQVAYGDSESMRKYCECVDNILNLCKKGVRYHPETILLNHIKSTDLCIERINFNYKLKNNSF